MAANFLNKPSRSIRRKALRAAEPSSVLIDQLGWHSDCIAAVMTDERYFTLLLWTICVLTFACSVVALTEHPEWFGT